MALHEQAKLRDKTQVFADRGEGGRALAGMLRGTGGTRPLVMAVAAGGVPVGAVVAEELTLPFDFLVVERIPFPWNPQAGYGAAASDGTVRVHQGLIFDMGLTEPYIGQGKRKAAERARERWRQLRGTRPFPELAGRTVILVDDAVGSSMTMATAAQALRKARPERVVAAVPSGHETALARLAELAEEVYCANVRTGWGFTIGDAYRSWGRVSERELEQLLGRLLTA